MIKKSLIMVFFLIFTGLFFVPVCSAAQPEVSSEAAVLMDMESGQILYRKNPDKRMYPASTTKILTTLVTLRKGNQNDMVKVSRAACQTDGSAIGVQEDEVIKLENLLFAVMLSSANDGAVAVAEHIGGSVEGFAHLMNSTARQIGAINSNFVSPHGLHNPNHYTTARDMALIAREAMKNPVFRKIVGTCNYHFERFLPRPVVGVPQVDFVNLNRLLWAGSTLEYKGATGIKTGYTDEARQCLVASAKKNDRELLVVVYKTENFGTYKDSAALLDYGFNEFSRQQLAGAGTEVGVAPVKKGVTGEIGVVTAGAFSYNVPVKEKSNIDRKIYIDGSITAPVEKGQKVGSMLFYDSGKQVGSVDLLADRDVMKEPLFRWWYGPVVLLLLVLYLRARARARRRRYYMARRKKWG